MPDVEHSPALLEKLQSTVRNTPIPHINHTDYDPLLNRPICLSIETKRTGEEWSNGLGKMISWLYGHWKRLQELAAGSTGDTGDIFLPGLVVQGHSWHFVAATQGQV